MSYFSHLLRCPICGSQARRTTRKEIARGPKELYGEFVYVCKNFPECDTYVGCHKGTWVPMGTLADRNLRNQRVRAHRAFDWSWKSNKMTRHESYELMAELLEVDFKSAHIGKLDLGQCQKVIKKFNSFRPWKMPHR